MALFRIAIVGGGPGGLALARLFHVASIPYKVFEADTSPDVRNNSKQSLGGTLDLHASSGQMAIRAAGLYEPFEKLSRRAGEALRIADSTGTLHVDIGPENSGRDAPEIDRKDLRKMLLDSIPSESILWGRKVESVSPSENPEQWDVNFSNGEKAEGYDLVVGADGAWSKVRPVLSDAKPYYSGATFVEFHIKDADNRQPVIGKFVGQGTYYAVASPSEEKASLASQRNSDGTIRTYAIIRVPQTWAAETGIDFNKDVPRVKKLLLEQFYNGWSQKQRDLVQLADDDFANIRPLYMLPVGARWESKPGITLIGDAAHLMTPFAGVGVNLALHDAYELSQRIIAKVKGGDLRAAVKEYDEDMFQRATENAEKTAINLERVFSLRVLESFKLVD